MKTRHYIGAALFGVALTAASTVALSAKPCNANALTCFHSCNAYGFEISAAAGGSNQQSGSGNTYAYAAGYNGEQIVPFGSTKCAYKSADICGKVDSCEPNNPES